MRSSLAVAVSILALATGVGQAQQVTQAPPGQERLDVTEEWSTVTLPEASPHWIWVLDVAFDNLIASRINIFDGDSGKFLGVVHSGFVPNLLLSPDKREIYVDETYWSRGSQGDRVDVVSIYDARTLLRTGEVILPQGRALIVPKLPTAQLSPDGRFLLSFNMNPATSVSLVDIRERRYVGEIETPGCSFVYPTGPRSFSLLCPDGSFADVTYDDSGRAQIANNQPFFDAESDPVFEHAAIDVAGGRGYFLSYEGMFYEVAFENGRTRVSDRWSLTTAEEKEDGWRPGGWQLVSWHPGLRRAFVLMHRGPRWSHKQPGEEVWVVDPEANAIVDRFALEEPSISLLITPDAEPLLATLTDTGVVGIYDPESGEHLRSIDGTGVTPFLLHAAGG